MCDTPGMPFIETSTGYVTSFSTSSGASPGVTVITWTSTGETSGKASMGSLRQRERAAAEDADREERDEQPVPEREGENAVDHVRDSRLILVLAEAPLQQLGLELERALGDDVSPARQAGRESSRGRRRREARRSRDARRSVPARRRHEDDGLSVELLHGQLGHDERSSGRRCRRRAPAGVSMRTCANIPGRRRRPAFSTSTRTLSVRLAVSTTPPAYVTRPGNVSLPSARG